MVGISKNVALTNYTEASFNTVAVLIAVFSKYGIDNNCSFIDIGSGFGKVVF
jgi:hypothetical protein